MRFKPFAEFVKERAVLEAEAHANKEAMTYDTKIQGFHHRFPDGDGEKIIKAAGYKDVPAFLHDTDERKWTRLQIPGQDNYVKKNRPEGLDNRKKSW